MDINECIITILPPNISSIIINTIETKKLNEIRIRKGKKIVVNLHGKLFYLSSKGITSNYDVAITASGSMIEEIVKRSSEHSFYAYANQIRQGFITVVGGIRVGICGEVVVDGNNIKTIKNINSLNIRIPHQVYGCAEEVLSHILTNSFENTLIISPPGCGKTTIIRDILHLLTKKKYCYNILLVDERYEIASSYNGTTQLDVGEYTDIISGSTKHYGFEYGVRSMSPDIVVTDEVYSFRDLEAIESIASTGVKILTSVHGLNLDDIKNKQTFLKVLENKIFKRFVVLSSRKGPGTIEGIYDENFRCINYWLNFC